MAYTMEEFIHETHQQFLGSMTAEERQAFLSQLSPEEVFQRFTPEERLRGLGPEERLRGLGPEERLRGLGPEELLGGLSEAKLEYLRQFFLQGERKH